MAQVRKQLITDNYSLYNGDCVEVISGIPDNSIHFSIFSPPFGQLYSYSDSPIDMSNSTDEQFISHMGYMVSGLNRIMMPGRIVAVHCMNLPMLKGKHGEVGLFDFRGDLIRLFQEYGFIFHSEVTIWKDPLVAMQRTKSIRLLHKQLIKDSAMCGQGLPDYLITFRKRGDNPERVSHSPRGFERYIGEDEISEEKTNDPATNKYSHIVWQRYASPVWMDIRQSDTLQFRAAREDDDERHICPLQKQVVHRALELWTNPNDVVFTPFMGIGTEVYCSLEMGRMGIGVELKESYFDMAVKNIKSLQVEHQASLF